jgi:hypothetical protein
MGDKANMEKRKKHATWSGLLMNLLILTQNFVGQSRGSQDWEMTKRSRKKKLDE